MKIVKIKEGSDLAKMLDDIERLMRKHNIEITGNNLRLCVDGKEFHIGQDSASFPRFVDEPFWKYKDD